MKLNCQAGVAKPLVAVGLCDIVASAASLLAPEQLKTSKQQLRALLADIEASHESEKIRFARLLHDDLSQKLTALLIELSLLEASVDPATKQGKKVSELSEIVSSISQSVRRLTNELRLKVLDEFGLVAAIRHEGQRFAKEQQIRFVVTPERDDLAVAPEIGTEVFRIFQKIVTKMVVQHGANDICVRVECAGRNLHLRIAEHSNRKRRKKLFSDEPLVLLRFQEQLHRLEGELKVVDIPTAGSIATIKVPTRAAKCRSTRFNTSLRQAV